MKAFWSKLGNFGKTVALGLAGAAVGGAIDSVTQLVQSGSFSPSAVKGAAISGAIAGVIGLWVKKPSDVGPPPPPLKP